MRRPWRSSRLRTDKLSKTLGILLPNPRSQHTGSPRQLTTSGPAIDPQCSIPVSHRSRLPKRPFGEIDASGLWPGKLVTGHTCHDIPGRRNRNIRIICNATRTRPLLSLHPTELAITLTIGRYHKRQVVSANERASGLSSNRLDTDIEA